MPVRSRLASLIGNLLFRKRVEQDLDDELGSYLDLVTEEKRGAGLSATEARRAALVALGGIDQVKESVRDVRAGAIAEQCRQDLFYACRLLARNRGFTAVAIATLALGIGANTAIFTVVDTVVFRPLPYREPGRLMKISVKGPREKSDNMAWADFEDIRAERAIFEDVAADDGMGFELRRADGTRESIAGAFVTSGWLPTLGVQPILGRGFLPEEFEPGRDRVAVLSHSYWQRHLGADPNVLGLTLTIDDKPFTVVGVLPPNVLRYGADFLKPLVAADYPRARSHRDLDVFARLEHGITLEQARAGLDVLGRRLAREYPATNANREFSLEPLGKYYVSQSSRADYGLLLMLSAVGLVLLIACANVTNLLLARGMARARECLIRTALGASRGRLVRQMLVESVLLFLAGGALGVLLARWAVDSLVAFAVAGGYVPDRMAVTLDPRVLAFTCALSVVAGVLSGLVPSLRASRIDLNHGLRVSSQSTTGDRRRTRASRLLIVSEIAVSVVLLVGSGLMIRSFLLVAATSGGIDPQNLLMTASDGGRDFRAAVDFWRATLDEARLVPGVESVAVSSRPPVHDSRSLPFVVDTQSTPVAETVMAGDILISADYFRTMGIPLLKGRAFSDRDTGGAPPVAIVSERLARRYFGESDPLGRRVRLEERAPMACCAAAGPVEGVWREIVGVVGDVRQASLDDAPAMTIYRPYAQIVEHDMFFMVRTRSSADAGRIATQLRGRLLAMDSRKVWADVRPMQEVIDDSESIRRRRFVLTLLAGFAAIALLLAAVGTYGVMSYAVVERTREIGIRMALGASSPTVLRDVLGDATRVTLAGLAIGTVAAAFLTRFIAALLFGINSADPLTYLGVAVVLSGVSLLASYVPARRALRIDPLIALRQE
jgi:putative ABC transport system permease protein